MAAVHLMRLADMPFALTFDMGGTSADMAVLTEGKVTFTTTARVGGLPLMMPVVGVNTSAPAVVPSFRWTPKV